VTDIAHWKQKYYDTLGELEEKEREWQQAESVLRQFVVRLTLAADTSNNDLMRQLDILRSSMRGGMAIHQLQPLIDNISAAVLVLDEQRRSNRLPLSGIEALERFLSELRFPHGTRHKALELQRQLQSADNEQVDALVPEVAALIMEAFTWLEQNPVRDGADEQDMVDTAKAILQRITSVLQEDTPLVQQLSHKVSNSRQLSEIMRLAEELALLVRRLGGQVNSGMGINEVLLQLLERIDVPNSLGEAVLRLKAQLAKGLAASEVERVLAAIADLISSMRSQFQHEKSELEEFLKQLTERLGEIDQGFQQNVEAHRSSYRGGRQLDAQVNAEMAGIEESVQQASDLTLLKQTVQQRVDTIRQHLFEFRSDEEQRIEQMEGRVKALAQRLAQVQKESEQLRSRVRQERDLAMQDSLTGIANRLAWEERLAVEFQRWKRYQSPLTLSVWDVDRFKLVNDTYGHQAGDRVLAVVAKLLRKQIRETDFIARYGGEEFVILLPETDLARARQLAENLRRSIEQAEFHFRNKRVPITISCGLSEFRHGDSTSTVFDRADKALYRAKEAGRNRCLSDRD
jgi:diguanylate cyclase